MTPRLRPFVVTIDGLSSAGKTTQAGLLAEHFRSSGIWAHIARGDGCRDGAGGSENDPLSSWWQKNSRWIRNQGHDGQLSNTAAAMAWDRLQLEIDLVANLKAPRQILCRDTTGVLITDRGLISRLFVASRYEKLKFNDILYYRTPFGGKRPIVLPDLIIILDAPPDILLGRLAHSDRDAEQRQFRREVIMRYYDDFTMTVKHAIETVGDRLVVLDASLSRESLKSKIIGLYTTACEEH